MPIAEDDVIGLGFQDGQDPLLAGIPSTHFSMSMVMPTCACPAGTLRHRWEIGFCNNPLGCGAQVWLRVGTQVLTPTAVPGAPAESSV
jgi:hypothetical protein